METARILQQACYLITSGETEAASRTLHSAFPTRVQSTARKSWSRAEVVRLFVRDHFTDRYSGAPLIFPGALRALSVLLPEQFPYHPNWKQSVVHEAYWTHYPTIDHVVPVARGGADDESNIVTTSMLRNAAKSNWLLSELGWPEVKAAVLSDWDGLLPWFCTEYERNSSLRSVSSLKAWYAAARVAT